MLHGEGGSTWVSSPTRGKDEAPEAPGNRDESSNPMCAPARSITRGVHHGEPPFSFLPARGPRFGTPA